MKKTSLPVVFFGSGPVAAESLRRLSKNFTVETVVTKPRPEHHKGDVPVIRVATELGLPIHTVVNKRTLDQLIASKPFKSKLGILIDFGIIVSQQVIDYFPLGIINSHFSLLPQWRGADPITFSILSGQKETGVSLMLLTAGMDEGPVLGFGTYKLSHTITAPELTADLISLSDSLLQHLVPLYAAGDIVAKPQNDQEPTYSRKFTKSDGIIDWSKPAEILEREIRAFIEWPRSSTVIAGKDVVITAAHVVAEQHGSAGVAIKFQKQLMVYCGTNALIIDKLKPAGKKEMTGQAFLAGYGKDL